MAVLGVAEGVDPISSLTPCLHSPNGSLKEGKLCFQEKEEDRMHTRRGEMEEGGDVSELPIHYRDG